VVAIDPLNAGSWTNLGLDAYYLGRSEEAIGAWNKALELSPERPAVHTYLGRIAVFQGRPQEALAEIQQEPELLWRLYGLAIFHHALGDRTQADAALAELIGKFQRDAAYQIAEVYAFRGDADRAFEWLDRSYAQRDGGLTEVKGDPLLRKIRSDPRYTALLKKMRLPL
jgi:tetratricopeptide (TPR) repeat protein